MKKELLQALGKSYTLESSILVNRNVLGFDHTRNVAQVIERNGKLSVRKYVVSKRWFGEEILFDNVEDAVSFIRGGNG